MTNELDDVDFPGWVYGLGKASLWMFLPAAAILAPVVANFRWRSDEVPKVAFWLLLTLPLVAGAVHRAPGVIVVGYILAAAVGLIRLACAMMGI